MMIHEITPLAGKYKDRKRIGRGPAAARASRRAAATRARARVAVQSRQYQFEGGQMPYFRRMPKFGFSNAEFREHFWLVNLRAIAKHPAFAGGGTVNAETLIGAGLVRDTSKNIKILGAMPEGESELKIKLDVTANRVTDPARRLIEAAGGKVTETGTRRDRVRGVDRNSDDRSPKNQTKKAKRRAFQQKKAAAAARGEVLKKS